LDIRSTSPPPAADRPPELSKRSVLLAVIRRGGPKILEASVAPGVLFYVCLVFGSLGLAYLTAVAWVFGCVARRVVRGQPVPQILVLSAIGIIVRTVVAIGSGSSFMYFAQPILGTVVTGGVFLASLIGGRPLIGRLADDFWPITPEMHANPRITSLFRGLTILWAGVNLVTASVTFVLLLWLPMTTYVVAKQLSGWSITFAAVALTIAWSHRTACREGIVLKPARRAVPIPVLEVS
jgi:hypothetical protein